MEVGVDLLQALLHVVPGLLVLEHRVLVVQVPVGLLVLFDLVGF